MVAADAEYSLRWRSWMNPNHALELLKAKMDEFGLVRLGWSGTLDNAVRRFGSCSPGRKRITLSRHLATINSDEETLDTVLHEIAHALAWVEHGEDCGHDERWKAIARRLGARPESAVDVDEAVSVAGAWALIHGDTGEVFRSYHKRPQRSDVADIWIRGRRSETEGKLVIVSARELAQRQGQAEDGPDSNVIRSFDRPTVHELGKKITAAVAAVCEEHGLTVEKDGGGFDAGSYSCGFVIRVLKEHVDAGDRAEFALHAHLFGLTSEDFGRQFELKGRQYSLVGFKPRNRKYPVIACDADTKRYKFPPTVLEDLK
jgi:hypothetical protein